MSVQLTDQTGSAIFLKTSAQRIISVVPSQTELLCHLNLEKQLMGITKFCVHPRAVFEEKEKVGGTKKLKIDKIKLLNPDLIIANKEENTKADILELKKYFQVYISDVLTLKDNYLMISDVGKMTAKEAEAEKLITPIKSNFAEYKLKISGFYAKAAYFIWQNPIMVAGNNNIINTLLNEAGIENVFSGLNRYPIIEESDLIATNPKIVLLSSEPFPFKEKHAAAFQKMLPNAKFILVDGEMFSWYGSHLLQSTTYFSKVHQTIENAILSEESIFQV